MEKILWVEGQTEQVCFSRLLDLAGLPLPKDTTFLPMRSTGDFHADAQQTADIYRRLSTMSAIMPQAVGFCFDRELKSDQQIADIKRQLDGSCFTERRMFENYLLDEESLCAFIVEIDQRGELETAKYVSEWIAQNHASFLPPRIDEDPFTKEWKQKIDAAKFLQRLICDATQERYKYNKINHGKRLLELVYERRAGELSELLEMIKNAINA